jgi:hypothetical protein
MEEYVKTIFQKISGKFMGKHAVPSIFGFPKFSLNSKIEEKMCAALPENLNQLNSKNLLHSLGGREMHDFS